MSSAGHRRTCDLLSVVVACFDEEDALPTIHRRLVDVLEAAPGLAFELVYVDDGSRDATLHVLREYQQADPRVRVVALSRNFGRPTAHAAGVQFVFIGILGEYVGRIYAEVKRRPLYLIKERRGFPADDVSAEAHEPSGDSAALRPARSVEHAEGPPR